MKLYRVGDRIIDLTKISYIEKLADDRVWCIIDGQPLSIDAPDGNLIFGLLENQIPKSIRQSDEKGMKWAIAYAEDSKLLINSIGILESNCKKPMLFRSTTEATQWVYRHGLQEPIRVIEWKFESEPIKTLAL